MPSRNRNAFCSFCRKSYLHVGPLVEGPGDVYICGECVVLCQDIIEKEKRRHSGAAGNQPQPPNVGEILDRLVDGYESAKAALADAAQLRQDGKGRVLLVGPSRGSAMFLAKAVAFALKVPFAAGEASDLDKSTAENPLFRLLAAVDFDLEIAKSGVLFIGGMDRLDAQDALVKLWRERVYEPAAGLQLDGILFVCAGTFAELDPANGLDGREALRLAGARSEWVDCLSAVAYVPPLDEKALERLVEWVDVGRSIKSTPESA